MAYIEKILQSNPENLVVMTDSKHIVRVQPSYVHFEIATSGSYRYSKEIDTPVKCGDPIFCDMLINEAMAPVIGARTRTRSTPEFGAYTSPALKKIDQGFSWLLTLTGLAITILGYIFRPYHISFGGIELTSVSIILSVLAFEGGSLLAQTHAREETNSKYMPAVTVWLHCHTSWGVCHLFHHQFLTFSIILGILYMTNK